MRLLLAFVGLSGAPFVVVGKVEPSRTPRPVLLRMPPRPVPQTASPRRPPQFVVVSFDGSGGIRLWPYWRSVARRAHAPFVWGSHFEAWNHWAYDRALTRFLLETCRLPNVRCVSYRELVDWLDSRTGGGGSAPNRTGR